MSGNQYKHYRQYFDMASTINNIRDIPKDFTIQQFAADVLKPQEWLHCMIADSDTIKYGTAAQIGGNGTATAHHYLPRGIFLFKGINGQLMTWHNKVVLK